MTNHHNKPMIACDFGAIAPQDRTAHASATDGIFSAVLEIKEIADGYAFQLPLDNDMLQQVVQFVSNERLCCAFFTFTIIINDQLWLQLSGDKDVKAYIKQVIVNPIIETGKLQWADTPQAFVSEEAYNAALKALNEQ